MDQNLPGADQGFTGMDASGKDIEFEGVDDAENLMAKLKKAGFKFKVDYREEVEESYEIGTDKYRKHTEDVTPGEDGEWVEAINAKNQTMREALAKVWSVDEGKSPFKKEDKKGDKTLTGKKVASVDVNPTIKEKTK